MTEAEKLGLLAASRMLAYPDAAFMEHIHELADAVDKDGEAPMAAAIKACSQALANMGQRQAAMEYVAAFDHASAASPYMAWHRYGNDRGQGRALAALNGLYRTAGFEPQPGIMPDYLPHMLEFLSAAPDWAREALLDGFGPEMAALVQTLAEMESPYAPMLAAALEPLKREHGECFTPRKGPDPTKRPMARPEPEPLVPPSLDATRPERMAPYGQE